MRLLIKQRVFTWSDTYDVYDEYENPKYYVKAEIFAWGHQLHVYDQEGNELGVIHQKVLSFLPEFEIEINGEVIGTIYKNFTFFQIIMKLNIWDGRWKVIIWVGIMIFMMEKRQYCILIRRCWHGAIPMCLILCVKKMKLMAYCWYLPSMPLTVANKSSEC